MPRGNCWTFPQFAQKCGPPGHSLQLQQINGGVVVAVGVVMAPVATTFGWSFLNTAEIRAKKKWLAGPAANHLSGPLSNLPGPPFRFRSSYAVNELPQPQFRSAFGF